jgi:hypothetical protein
MPRKRITNGDGLLDPFINRGFSNAVQTALNLYGDVPITRLQVIKNKINPYITQTLNYISSQNFDALYHLGLIVHLANGKSVILEKRSSIVIREKYTLKNRELQDVQIPNDLTLNVLLKGAFDKVGNKLFLYSGFNNNCQNFVLHILKWNNLLNSNDLKQFIKQDTEAIFKNPNVRKLVNTVTDIGGVYDNVKDGFNSIVDTVTNNINPLSNGATVHPVEYPPLSIK